MADAKKTETKKKAAPKAVETNNNGTGETKPVTQHGAKATDYNPAKRTDTKADEKGGE